MLVTSKRVVAGIGFEFEAAELVDAFYAEVEKLAELAPDERKKRLEGLKAS